MPNEPDPILAALLIRHEGRRTHPYRDSTGHITIGVGRNLTDRGLAADEIDLLLVNDMALAHSIVADLYGPHFAAASPARQYALLSMAFNLGGPRLAGFVKMRQAVMANTWQAAAAEAMASRWAVQTGPRATELAGMLRDG